MARRKHETLYKLPLVLEPPPEGGYTVTCPLLPELLTEGDTAQEALLDAYRRLGRPVPAALKQNEPDSPLWLESRRGSAMRYRDIGSEARLTWM